MEVIKKGFNVSSMSVDSDEIYLIRVNKEDTILMRDKEVPHEEGDLLLVDRLRHRREGNWSVTQVRDQLPMTGRSSEDWDYGSVSTPAWFRRVCIQRGATEKYVPGQVVPLHHTDTVMVNAFAMSGTTYYEVPIKVFREFFPEYQP